MRSQIIEPDELDPSLRPVGRGSKPWVMRQLCHPRLASEAVDKHVGLVQPDRSAASPHDFHIFKPNSVDIT